MDLKPAEPTVIAICCFVIVAALVLGVGLATNLVLRHIVQTAPLWIGVILGFRHSRAASWAALPLFLVWLFLMALIWLYLLGIPSLLSGHFAPVEIAMTIIVGAAASVGHCRLHPFQVFALAHKGRRHLRANASDPVGMSPGKFSSGHCSPINRGST